MARLRLAGVLVLVFVLAGCRSSGQSAMKLAERRSGLTVAERHRILSWLQCEECVDGELERVILLGKKEATAVDSLATDLLGGPSAMRRSNVRKQFESSYEEDAAYAMAAGSQPPLTRTQYVDHYLDNFINLYRVRAARALAEIGGSKAAAILDSAVKGVVRTPGDSLRADAKLKVLFARDSILPGVLAPVDSAP